MSASTATISRGIKRSHQDTVLFDMPSMRVKKSRFEEELTTASSLMTMPKVHSKKRMLEEETVSVFTPPRTTKRPKVSKASTMSKKINKSNGNKVCGMPRTPTKEATLVYTMPSYPTVTLWSDDPTSPNPHWRSDMAMKTGYVIEKDGRCTLPTGTCSPSGSPVPYPFGLYSHENTTTLNQVQQLSNVLLQRVTIRQGLGDATVMPHASLATIAEEPDTEQAENDGFDNALDLDSGCETPLLYQDSEADTSSEVDMSLERETSSECDTLSQVDGDMLLQTSLPLHQVPSYNSEPEIAPTPDPVELAQQEQRKLHNKKKSTSMFKTRCARRNHFDVLREELFPVLTGIGRKMNDGHAFEDLRRMWQVMAFALEYAIHGEDICKDEYESYSLPRMQHSMILLVMAEDEEVRDRLEIGFECAKEVFNQVIFEPNKYSPKDTSA